MFGILELGNVCFLAYGLTHAGAHYKDLWVMRVFKAAPTVRVYLRFDNNNLCTLFRPAHRTIDRNIIVVLLFRHN